jgi:hypothetical protein
MENHWFVVNDHLEVRKFVKQLQRNKKKKSSNE